MIPAQLQPTKISFAAFFQAQDFGDKITLSSRLRDAAGGTLDGEPLILPVPANANPDVPRVQLQSRDSRFVLQLSMTRLVLEWKKGSIAGETWEGAKRPYLVALAGILRVFVGEYARPQKFRFLPQFVLPTESSATEFLASRVFQPGRLTGPPHTVRFGLLDSVALNGREAQLWMNVSTARHVKKPEWDRALVLEFELTPQDGSAPLTGEETMNLIFAAEEVMGRRIRESLGELLVERKKED